MVNQNVLIVDDDREITRAVELRLRKAGFRTNTAFDGAAGFAIAQRDPPDAIVLDLRMPVMDGFELLERLQNSVHTRNIPAIILSADAADRARLKALRAGATHFVEKPYRAKDLLDALGTSLHRRQAAIETFFPSETRERKMAMPEPIRAPDDNRRGTDRR